MDSKLHTPLLLPTLGVVVGVVVSQMLGLDLYAPLVTVVIGGVLFLWRGWSVALLILALGCGALRMSIEDVETSGHTAYTSVSRVEWSEDSFVGELQSKAIGRIERLEFSDRAEGLAKATILGQVGAITPDQRYAYGVSGASHLLAVSGLHLSVIFLLLNFLLLPIVLLPRGHIIRGVVIVCVMWFYAAVVGFSPSVVRSVVMFSVLQAAWSMGRQYNNLNSLMLAFLVGVIYSPMLLYSVGFQLSVISVAAILLWGMPLYREFFGGEGGFLVSALCIGMACAVATMPIVSHLFGYIPLLGIFVGPLMVLTLSTIICVGVVWLISGVEFIAPIVRLLIEIAAMIQERTVEWVASQNWGFVEWEATKVEVILIYLIYIVVTILVWSPRKRKKVES